MPLHRPIKRDQRRLFTNVKATPRITAPQRSQPPARRILVTGMSAILIVAVLAFGGNDYWSVTILEAGSVILLLFWLLPQLSSGKIQLRSGLLYLPMILFGSIIVAQVVLGLSAYAYVTRFELWKYAAYGGLFLLANQCGRTEAHRLLTILATFGFVVALCALLQYLTGRGEIYWKWPGLSSSFGPYFDHNHYAGLMEMLTPIPLVIALMEGSRRHAQLLWMVPAILMAATIFVCGSRGGMTAFVVEIAACAGFFVMRKRPGTTWILLVTCLVIAAFALWIDSGSVLKRLGSLWDPLTNVDVTSRLAVARDIPRMVRDRPITGWGLGLFPIVYPEYRSFSTNLVVNQAHNDYLQALVETGVLGFACVLWFIANLYRTGIHNVTVDFRGTAIRTVGPLVGCTGILVHSLSEFNLHVPANAALFFVLSGIASGTTTRSDT